MVWEAVSYAGKGGSLVCFGRQELSKLLLSQVTRWPKSRIVNIRPPVNSELGQSKKWISHGV